MTDDDAYEAHRDRRDMGPASTREPDAPAFPRALTAFFCATCRLFHAAATSCAVARAAVEAQIMEEGELVGEEEIGDCDRIALLAALRVRGMALEPEGDRWRVVGTVAA